MAHWVRRRGSGDAPLSRHDRVLLFWESFLGNFLFSICMLFGVMHSTALAAGVIMAAIPAVVALLSWAFLRERITTRVAVGIVFAVAGIALVSASRHDAADAGSLLGNALLFGAVVCEASYVVIGKKLTGSVSPRRISALVNLWGLALVTPLGLWQALALRLRRRAAIDVAAVAVLFVGRQHVDRLALDDRPAPCARFARGRLHRDAADHRRGRRHRSSWVSG